jgi:hypothetical protein
MFLSKIISKQTKTLFNTFLINDKPMFYFARAVAKPKPKLSELLNNKKEVFFRIRRIIYY